MRKKTDIGIRLCAYIPKTKNAVFAETKDKLDKMLKSSNNRQAILKMVSEFSPGWIIGLELSLSFILLQLFIKDRPDDFLASNSSGNKNMQ